VQRSDFRSFIGALPVLGLAVLIIGGIRFGVVTPTEAGVLAVVYSWVLGMFVYRSLWRAVNCGPACAPRPWKRPWWGY
jgi:TRAP-type C4-dicarboxylate transport system permease large subunit